MWPLYYLFLISSLSFIFFSDKFISIALFFYIFCRENFILFLTDFKIAHRCTTEHHRFPLRVSSGAPVDRFAKYMLLSVYRGLDAMEVLLWRIVGHQSLLSHTIFTHHQDFRNILEHKITIVVIKWA